MKQHFSVFLPVVLLLVLAGCDCNHDWTPADCVNPQVCTKCEEVGDPALGHDWVDATCSAPQTCSRCGAAEGEASGHNYGTWTFAGDLMSHTCTVCNHLEEQPLDHVLYVESLLTGTWDLYEVYYEADTVLAKIDDPFKPDGVLSIFEIFSFNPEYHSKIIFSDKHGLEFTYGGLFYAPQEDSVTDGTWELHTFNPDTNEYTLLYHSDKNTDPVVLILRVGPDGSREIVFDIPEATFIYKHSSKPVDALTGSGWVLAEDDKNIFSNGDFSSWLLFYTDGTGILRWGQEIEFNWYLVPLGTGMGYGLKLDYELNGRHTYIFGFYALEHTHIGVPTIQLLDKLGDITAFRQVTDAEFAIIQNASVFLTGTWTQETDNESYNEADNYTITFTKDGSFTAKSIDGDIISGRWILTHFPNLEERTVYYQENNVVSYTFQLFSDSFTEPVVQCDMTIRRDEFYIYFDLYFKTYPAQFKCCRNFAREYIPG